MSDDSYAAIAAARAGFMQKHLDAYLGSEGREGHIIDMTDIGGKVLTTTLLLKTVGAKSGETRVLPLIYGVWGGEVVIVASKGGADSHPGWYFNIAAAETVEIQIGGQAFTATHREPEGAEYEAVWAFMAGLFPPYDSYKVATDRKIPLVMFQIGDEAARFKAA